MTHDLVAATAPPAPAAPASSTPSDDTPGQSLGVTTVEARPVGADL